MPTTPVTTDQEFGQLDEGVESDERTVRPYCVDCGTEAPACLASDHLGEWQCEGCVSEAVGMIKDLAHALDGAAKGVAADDALGVDGVSLTDPIGFAMRCPVWCDSLPEWHWGGGSAPEANPDGPVDFRHGHRGRFCSIDLIETVTPDGTRTVDGPHIWAHRSRDGFDATDARELAAEIASLIQMAGMPDRLPPVDCMPWCEDGDGHPHEIFRADQWCRSEETVVFPLAHKRKDEPDGFALSACRTPDGHEEVCLRHLRLDVETFLSPAEARALAAALVETADLAAHHG